MSDRLSPAEEAAPVKKIVMGNSYSSYVAYKVFHEPSSGKGIAPEVTDTQYTEGSPVETVSQESPPAVSIEVFNTPHMSLTSYVPHQDSSSDNCNQYTPRHIQYTHPMMF